MKTLFCVMAVVLMAVATSRAANVDWKINGDIPAGMEGCLAVLVMSNTISSPTVGWDAGIGSPTLIADVGSKILAIMPLGDVSSFSGLTYAYPDFSFEWCNIENPDLWTSETDIYGGIVDVPAGYFYFHMIVFHSDMINGIGGSEWMLEDANGTYFEYQVLSATGNPVKSWSQPEIYPLNFGFDDLPPGMRTYTELVPEPAAASLLAIGCAALLLRRRKR